MMPISRKKFIQLSSLSAASLLLPKFLKAAGSAAPVPPAGRVLVLLHLRGGNDGLNTIVPVRNDLYYRARPGLALPCKSTLPLNDETGLHPALANLKALYDEGAVTIVNGVGYPNPDRSHAGSTRIWQTAGGGGKGWTGHGLERAVGSRMQPDSAACGPALEQQLAGVAARIGAGDATSIYHLTHDSYDTHVGQLERQRKALLQLDGALAVFTRQLKRSGRFKEVLLLCFSEFGRRVAENTFGGTDHGTAGPVFLLGGSLAKPGLANEVPSLHDLDEGDLRHSVDFRSIYAGLLGNWLGMDAGAVPGPKFSAYSGAF